MAPVEVRDEVLWICINERVSTAHQAKYEAVDGTQVKPALNAVLALNRDHRQRSRNGDQNAHQKALRSKREESSVSSHEVTCETRYEENFENRNLRSTQQLNCDCDQQRHPFCKHPAPEAEQIHQIIHNDQK